MCRVKSGIEAITRAREGFRQIAKRGAVCFDISQYMCEINPLYQTSMALFLDVYDAAIAHSDRSVIEHSTVHVGNFLEIFFLDNA